MAKGLDNYVPVTVRHKRFRDDHKVTQTLTDVVGHDFVKECAIIKATLTVDGVILSTGLSLCSDLGEEKSFEKAETTAIGRALQAAGYEASDVEYGDSVEESKTTKKKKSGLGLGKKNKVEEEVEAEAVEEVEEVEEETLKSGPTTKKSNSNSKPKSNHLDSVLSKYGMR